MTAIVPGGPETLSAQPASAGVAVLNGAGEMTGALEISEWGLLQTPVYLTATMSVGRVLDGAVAVAVAADPTVGVEDVVIPVVAECDDSWLNDARVVQVEAADAARAVANAARGGPVAQGAVGAGTGMMCFEWKGGIGTASRMTEANGSMVGVLVLANFGVRSDLRVDGVPVGAPARRGRAEAPKRPAGSCIAIVATDAPLSARAAHAGCPPSRPRAGPHGLCRPPRKRRDLPRLLDGAAGDGSPPTSPTRISTRSSWRPSTPPRRPC